MILASGIEVPTDRIREISRRYQVRELSIFGSAARGGMKDESDVDVLVEFLPEANTGWDFFELENELTNVLGRRVDLGTKRSLKPWVRAEALRTAQVVYE